jgi:seryl-tRNA synthetase
MKRFTSWVVCGALTVGGVAIAASLDDFKEAVEQKGCTSIPYEDIRDSCKSNSEKVQEYCKGGRGPMTCDDLDPAGLTKQIENVKQKLEDLKQKKSDLEDKKSHSSDENEQKDLEAQIEAIADQIEKLESKLDEWKDKLEKEQDQINDRIDVGEQCLSYRKAVRDNFVDAKSKAKDESDPDIKPLAEKLVDKWEKGEEGHAKAIELANRAIEKCKEMRD